MTALDRMVEAVVQIVQRMIKEQQIASADQLILERISYLSCLDWNYYLSHHCKNLLCG